MVKGIGSLALAGPALVKAVTGQEIDEQELGGSKIHYEVSGVGDGEFENDAACLAAVKKYLSYLPSNCDEPPPDVPCDDPIDRRDEALLDLSPRRSASRTTCTSSFERSPITAISSTSSRASPGASSRASRASAAGASASWPTSRCTSAASSTTTRADKAAHFIQVCDAFNVPLVFLQDVPGFMVGSKVEHAGIIRHGAKMLHVMSAATVPKLTVVVRKAYGAGYYVMCGRAYEPDLLVSWPTGEISVMGAEGMVGIAAKKLFGDAEPPPEVKKNIVDMIQKNIDVTNRPAGGWSTT